MKVENTIYIDRNNKSEKKRTAVSSNQLQFWMIEKIHPGTPAYNISNLYKLKGNLDENALEKSINEIIKRHEIFRTTFSEEENNPFQVISSDLFIKLDKIELSNLSVEEKEERLNSLIESEINSVFDLEKGPLIRTKLFKLSESEHVIAITMHHIIFDMHSKELFSSELSAFYNAFHQNIYITFEIPHQYSEYANHQQKWFKSEECSKMIVFWKKQLEGKKQFLDFPIDKQYPPVLTLNGNEFYFDIPEELSASLKEYCSKETVDVFILLLTAYYILLYRYSRQVEITIGVPHTNRHRKEFKNIMGCFMNILPIQIDLSDDITLIEAISRVKNSMLLARPNQELPLDRIVNSIQLETSVSSNPLFQYGFTFEPPMKLDLTGIEVEPMETNLFGSRLNIFAVLWDNKTNLKGKFIYNTDLFERSAIERLKNNYLTLLESIVNSDNIPVSKLKILSDNEANIINEWNKTDCPYSEKKCIHDFLEEQNLKNPDITAVIFEGSSISFKELNSLSNRLAHYLISTGIKPGSTIGMCMDRSLEMIIAIYAILKVGGVYVPIDYSYPEDRLSFIVDDAKISRIITHKHIVPKIEKLKCELITIDSKLTEFNDFSEENPKVNVMPKDVAYIIYTSGSTGKPKGVMIEHHSVVNRLEWMQKRYPIARGDVILQKTAVTFDVSIWELFWWSFYGASVCMLIPGGEKDPEAIVNAVEKNHVTVMHFVPSMFHVFLEYLKVYESSKKLASLRQIFASGEALQLNDAQTFNQLLHKTNCTKLTNLYGPTEATVDVSYFDCIEDIDRVPIGKPIDNIKLFVMDNNNSIQPIGVPGELIIGGVGVARGYLNRPELNKEKFIQNPFNPDGTLFYRSGDLARYLPDGDIEYLGRIDHQVKIRGFRIELGEIETVLNSSKYVSESVVMPKEDEAEGKRLAAYIVPDKNTSHSDKYIQELKDYLKEKLPDYMIPAFFIILEKFPLLSNGKVDRNFLRAMKPDSKLNNYSYTAPQDETEKIIAEYWCKLLNLEKVGIDDNFFDIGGNSLLALKLQIDFSKEFDRKIEVLRIFENPTIRKFAKFLNTEDQNYVFDRIDDRSSKKIDALIKKRRRKFKHDI